MRTKPRVLCLALAIFSMASLLVSCGGETKDNEQKVEQVESEISEEMQAIEEEAEAIEAEMEELETEIDELLEEL